METIEIDGVKSRLTNPDYLDIDWIGTDDVVTQLMAAWTILDSKDIPLNPRILGQPGVGKTTLAYTAARKICDENGSKVYIFQCSQDVRPEDLIIQPVISENNKIEYHASSLTTAIIEGGICILDEANRMSEKSWASLAPLLDKRRYVESIIAGIKIKAHNNFRIVVTMNEDSSTYELPEYIDSRLQPKIFLDFPNAKDEYEILKYNVPHANSELLDYIINFLQEGHENDRSYSIRDGINIARYYLKLINLKTSNKNLENSEEFVPDLFELSLYQILDDEAIEFFNKFVFEDGNSENFFKIRKKFVNQNKQERRFDDFEEYVEDGIDYDDLKGNHIEFIDPESIDEEGDEVDERKKKILDFFKGDENEEDDKSSKAFILFLDKNEQQKKKSSKSIPKVKDTNPEVEYFEELRKRVKINLRKIKEEEKKTKKTSSVKKK